VHKLQATPTRLEATPREKKKKSVPFHTRPSTW